MKKISMQLLLSSVLLCSWGAIAKCDKDRESQTIEISRSGDTIVVENKELSQKCVVKNNKRHDENTGSQLVWLFRDIPCPPGHCRVELDGDPELGKEVFKCDIGNEQKSRCRLKVNKLKKLCRSIDPGDNKDSCEFNYRIWVGDQEIDPTIIIRPRPMAE